MSSQVGDIAAALAYQVKKEIAENFFRNPAGIGGGAGGSDQPGENGSKGLGPGGPGPLVLIGELLLDPETAKSFFALLGQERLPLEVPERPDRTFSEAVEACPLPFALTSQAKYQALIAQLYRPGLGRCQPLLEKVAGPGKKSPSI